MFRFKLSKLKITNENFILSEQNLPEDKVIINFLDKLESEVYQYLCNNDTSFKYIQGKLKSSFFGSFKDDFFNNQSSPYNVLFLTQHPNFVGGIVINDLLNLSSETKNFIITYENPISKNWLNSQVDYNDVVNAFKVINDKTDIKNDVDITFVRIYESDSIKFQQVNVGSSKPLYKLKTKK